MNRSFKNWAKQKRRKSQKNKNKNEVKTNKLLWNSACVNECLKCYSIMYSVMILRKYKKIFFSKSFYCDFGVFPYDSINH